MKCKYCGFVNEEDAVYCINCGKKLDGKIICSSCGTENEAISLFCKECGEKLKSTPVNKNSAFKEKGLTIGQLILKIIAVSMAAFIILFSFGACFAPFINSLGKGVGLIDFIKDLQKFKGMPAGTYGSDFYMLGEVLPSILCLSGACIALLGCSIAVVYGSVKAIQVGIKKQIPNLNNVALLATCSLLVGLLFSSLIFMYSKTSPTTSILAENRSIGYGNIVLSAVSIGFAWYFLHYILEFILEGIRGLSKEEILKRSFRLGEAIFLCIILFNLGSSFMTFVKTQESWTGTKEQLISGMSIGAFFTNLSEAVYNKTGDLDFVFSTSDVAGGYYLAMVILIMFIVILVAAVSLSFIRLRRTDKGLKASLGLAIPLVGMAITELTLSIVAQNVFAKPDGVFRLVLGYNYENVKRQVGPSIIVFTIFSILLLALEISWMIVVKKVKNEKEQEGYAM